MFTKRSVNYFGSMVNFLYAFSVVSIHWNKSQNQMKPGSPKQLRAFKLASFHFYPYFIFVSHQLYKEVYRNPIRYADLTFICIWVVGYLWMIMCSATTYLKRYEMASFYNELVKLNFQWKGKKIFTKMSYLYIISD